MTPTRGSHGKPHRTTKILSDARRRSGRVAARGPRAAAGDAGDRVPQYPITKQLGARFLSRVPPRPCSSGIRRWPKPVGVAGVWTAHALIGRPLPAEMTVDIKESPRSGSPNGGDPSVVKPLCRGFPTDFPNAITIAEPRTKVN